MMNNANTSFSFRKVVKSHWEGRAFGSLDRVRACFGFLLACLLATLAYLLLGVCSNCHDLG